MIWWGCGTVEGGICIQYSPVNIKVPLSDEPDVVCCVLVFVHPAQIIASNMGVHLPCASVRWNMMVETWKR